ncbi:MAG TPA: DUF1801 domain-containing protein [Pyrinomonadaceae bacterium]|nr:DUF1801 domain-containing protein [Pyrinomonadaceae bacterium]
MTSRSAEEVLKPYPADVQALTNKARRMLLKSLAGAEETVDPSAAVLSYGYGPGYRGMVCTLILSKSGVKIGFVRGAELADPSGLLEGAGKTHKYVQLRTASDLNGPALKQLIKTARVAWQQRNG